MAISTVQELRDAVDRYMKRSVSTNQFNDFLDVTEARFYDGDEDPEYGCEPLRVVEMVASSDLTITSGQAAKPTDFLEAIRIYLVSGGTNQVIEYYPPTDFWPRTFTADAGPPVGYTIEGSNFEFGSASSGTPKLLYYKKLDALDPSDTSSTNTILTGNPNVYLWGVLTEASLFIRNYENAAAYARRFRGAIGGWNGANRREKAVGPLITRPSAVA